MDKLYKMPERMRGDLAKPFGPVIQDADLPKHIKPDDIIVTVGDVTTEHVIGAGYVPRITITDGKTKRAPLGHQANVSCGGSVGFFNDPLTDLVIVSNPTGYITDELCEAIQEAAGNLTSTNILVDGEEDLATLACMFILPRKLPMERTVLLYGQPNAAGSSDGGMVVVRLSKDARKLAKTLLGFFLLEEMIAENPPRNEDVRSV